MPRAREADNVQRQDLENLLRRGLIDLDLDPISTLIQELVDYLQLLAKWNRAFNLSSIRDPRQMAIRHVLDSLAVAPYVEGSRLLDMGSGGGLPGIPLALAKPELHVVLLDSNGKKARFLRQAVLELRLDRVTVVAQRAETFRAEAAFDTVISRAFSDLVRFVSLSIPLCRPGGRILAMKGPLAEREATDLNKMGWNPEIFEIQVPGLKAERRLIRVVVPSGEHL